MQRKSCVQEKGWQKRVRSVVTWFSFRGHMRATTTSVVDNVSPFYRYIERKEVSQSRYLRTYVSATVNVETGTTLPIIRSLAMIKADFFFLSFVTPRGYWYTCYVRCVKQWKTIPFLERSAILFNFTRTCEIFHCKFVIMQQISGNIR